MANGSSQGGGSASQSGGSSGANILTHRVGPFPVWLWGLLAVGAYLIFFHKKSTGAAPSTGAVSAQPQTEQVTYPTGASYSGPVGYAPTYGAGGGGGGGGGPAPSPGNSTATPGGGNSAIAGGTVVGGGSLFQMGQGYSIKNPTGKLTGGSVYGGTGSIYSTIPTYAETVNLLNSGVPVYYQSAPGTFKQVTSASQLSGIEPAGAKGGPTDTTTYMKG